MSFSNSQIREAIFKAADHIEANPHEFNFWSITTPKRPGCGTPGCAIGWIGCFLGQKPSGDDFNKVMEQLGCPRQDDFYDRMRALDLGWKKSADRCAEALRQYADKYNPEQFPEIQKELSRIFKETPEWTPA